MAKLFLIPTTLENPINGHVLLQHQLSLIQHLRFFIVETAKIGRQHLKQLNLKEPIQNISINELNKHQGDLQSQIQPLLDGYDIGLLSDCGLPAIADPGSKIVWLAHKHKIEVVPLVGASSLMLALMSSGVNGQSFAFNGYIPIETSSRIIKVKELQKLVIQTKQSQIIIETPFRNQQLLQLLIATLANDITLSISINLMSITQRTISYPIAKWKTLAILPNIHKQEAVFIIGTS